MGRGTQWCAVHARAVAAGHLTPSLVPLASLGADDFQQPPGQVHPDMAQPGPGRGTDWDRMFG